MSWNQVTVFVAIVGKSRYVQFVIKALMFWPAFLEKALFLESTVTLLFYFGKSRYVCQRLSVLPWSRIIQFEKAPNVVNVGLEKYLFLEGNRWLWLLNSIYIRCVTYRSRRVHFVTLQVILVHDKFCPRTVKTYKSVKSRAHVLCVLCMAVDNCNKSRLFAFEAAQ
jgi:hypothetical protein